MEVVEAFREEVTYMHGDKDFRLNTTMKNLPTLPKAQLNQ
jgi:hypothetical protein